MYLKFHEWKLITEYKEQPFPFVFYVNRCILFMYCGGEVKDGNLASPPK